MGTSSDDSCPINQLNALQGVGLEVTYGDIKRKNGDLPPLKTFGCVCFVQNKRPNVGKLDPRAIKCVFVGYSGTQKGYVCWSPVEKN